MAAVAPSTERNYGPDTISEESDDLETPLQTWERLFGHLHPVMKSSTPESKELNVSPDGRVPGGTKRKLRSRVPFRKIPPSSSTDTDEAELATTTSQRRSRTKAKPAILSKKQRTKKIKSTKVAAAVQQQKPDIQFDLDLISDEDVGGVMKFSSRPTKRRSRRSTRKSRKKPISFLESPAPEVANLSYPEDAPNPADVQEEQEADSQRTILLDTPDFLESFEVADDSPKEEKNIKQDASDHRVEEKIATPERLSTSHASDDTTFIEEVEVKPDTTSFTAEKTPTRNKEAKSTDDDDKSAAREKASELMKTVLDDIFFDKRSSSPKKPPPSRRRKKFMGTKIFSAAVDSSTQESTCNSLLEDDSLWVTKS